MELDYTRGSGMSFRILCRVPPNRIKTARFWGFSTTEAAVFRSMRLELCCWEKWHMAIDYMLKISADTDRWLLCVSSTRLPRFMMINLLIPRAKDLFLTHSVHHGQADKQVLLVASSTPAYDQLYPPTIKMTTGKNFVNYHPVYSQNQRVPSDQCEMSCSQKMDA